MRRLDIAARNGVVEYKALSKYRPLALFNYAESGNDGQDRMVRGTEQGSGGLFRSLGRLSHG